MSDKKEARRSGGGWTDDQILAVWNKGAVVPGYDPSQVRQDCYGALIEFSKYGQAVDGDNGWEIDHIVPVISGGTHQLSNLQPLQWQNNRFKGCDMPGSKIYQPKSKTTWL